LQKKFTGQSVTITDVTTTTEMYINGEKVTKKNSIKVIFNKLKSRQKRKDVKNAMKEKKKLKRKLN
tara:strand:- start:363 stop:560 length:198 start_codon:yes stop_codon:yes gene_type:complete